MNQPYQTHIFFKPAILFLLFYLIFFPNAGSQIENTGYLHSEIEYYKADYQFDTLDNPVKDRNTIHSIQLEAGGPGILYSLRYDLNKELFPSYIKMSFSPGITYWRNEVWSHLLFPAKLTLLAGKELNIEAGIDISMGFNNINIHAQALAKYRKFNLHIFPYLGVRHQKRSNGLFISAGTVFIKNEAYQFWMRRMFIDFIPLNARPWMLWPSVGIGYTFRY